MKPNANAKKTSCLRGHPFDKANTYINSRGGRQCKACRKDRLADHHIPANGRKTLDEKAIARLKDALADGVSVLDCAARFGIGKGVVEAYAGRAS